MMLIKFKLLCINIHNTNHDVILIITVHDASRLKFMQLAKIIIIVYYVVCMK